VVQKLRIGFLGNFVAGGEVDTNLRDVVANSTRELVDHQRPGAGEKP
jgi:hypothetical protein